MWCHSGGRERGWHGLFFVCVLLWWERAWVALSPQTVHLAHCHTAAHAPTRGPQLSLVHTSTNHRQAVLTVTGIMGRQRHAWSGMAKKGGGRGGGGVERVVGV